MVEMCKSREHGGVGEVMRTEIGQRDLSSEPRAWSDTPSLCQGEMADEHAVVGPPWGRVRLRRRDWKHPRHMARAEVSQGSQWDGSLHGSQEQPGDGGGGGSCIALTEVKEREHSESHLQRDGVGCGLASACLSLHQAEPCGLSPLIPA